MSLPITYLVYLAVSIAITIWVARTLHRRGRTFLVGCYRGDETLADSANDLLVVGFYLLNFGYVALALRYGTKPTTMSESIEFLSTKIGLVLLVLGTIHFFNLYVFTKLRPQKSRRPRSQTNDRFGAARHETLG